MKIRYCSLFLLVLSALPGFCQPMNPLKAPPSTNAPAPDKEKVSEMIGSSFGRSLSQPEVKDLLDVDTIVKAMKDYMAGKPDLTDVEGHEVSRQLSAYISAQRQIKAEQTLKEGQDFLAKNGQADGVKTLPDGLQYKIVKLGTGDHPQSNDTVTVKYRGTLIDGTEFDHNDSAKFSLRGVIPGWKEAVPMMTVGSEWQLYIPANLAYGRMGRPQGKIPGNSVLIFDMELLSTTPAPAPAPAAGGPPHASTAAGTNQIVSGEIIKVPSAEGLKRGEKIEVIQPGQTNIVDTAK